ncbi:hypothetical protein [Streptomyces sp. NPDC003036]|uniref:hypothetical protein n=1 Tax=Streptomyces sp. NPDC003036 TaxID=3154442 RepID=UPI0033AFA6CC
MTPPRPAVTAGVIAVRVILCLLIVLTLGMLAWVAMLRIAIVRRTGRDWALFWCQLVLNIGCLATLEEHFADHWISNVGMAGLLVQMVGVVVYYLIVDIHHRQRATAAPVPPMPPYGPPQPVQMPTQPTQPTQPYGYGPPATPPTPPAQPQPQPPRIDQVRAELDELSQLLRRDPRDPRNPEGDSR